MSSAGSVLYRLPVDSTMPLVNKRVVLREYRAAVWSNGLYDAPFLVRPEPDVQIECRRLTPQY